MPDATLDDAIKEAFASCSSKVIAWETIQVSHPSLPDGDLWFVKDRENRTLGFERGGLGTECGVNPGDPGPEPDDPSPVSAPGTEPPKPSNEPVVGDYLRSTGGNRFSFEPFNRYEDPDDGIYFYNYWVSYYADWQGDVPDPILREAAADKAQDMFDFDHDFWAALKAAHDAWQADSDAYDAYLEAHARHEAWVTQTADYEAWLTCTAGETLTQEFIGLAFDLTRASSGDSGIQELSFSACDVDRVMSDWLISVAESGSLDPIEVTYRIYALTDTSKPAIDPPLRLFLTDARVDIYTVSARASFADLVNRAFPNTYYTRDQFPSLGN